MTDASVNPEENYRTGNELKEIATLIDYLDNGLSEVNVEVALFDINGEALGYLRLTPGGTYGFYNEKAKVSPF